MIQQYESGAEELEDEQSSTSSAKEGSLIGMVSICYVVHPGTYWYGFVLTVLHSAMKPVLLQFYGFVITGPQQASHHKTTGSDSERAGIFGI